MRKCSLRIKYRVRASGNRFFFTFFTAENDVYEETEGLIYAPGIAD